MKFSASRFFFLSLLCLIWSAFSLPVVGEEELPIAVKIHCGGCHQAPRPGAMTRDAWVPTIQNMLTFIRDRKYPPIPSETLHEISQYYVRNSPLKYEPIPDDLEESKLEFEKISVGDLPVTERPQATHVRVCDLDGDGVEDDVVVCDNVHGTVSWLRILEDGKTWKETVLAKAPSPVRTTVFDFEGDGDMDIAVSAMGFMHPNDDLIGEFHLLINRGDQTFTQDVVVRGTPRISDVAPADFDGDGDIDFMLSMFGWRTTGGIGYLEQISPNRFSLTRIFEINGTMRIVPAYLNADKQLDFLALITQEHETIGGFINQGEGKFKDTVVARANHPVFGSSGIEWVDLDGDGDNDIVYTNGDMMDENPKPKPFHGVRWFENDNGKWNLRHLAAMPGCFCSTTRDMDGDGDLDVVVSALYFHWEEHEFPSLIWLENKGGAKEFVRRRIAYAPSNLATSAVGDFNNDGLPDIIGAGMHVPGPTGRKGRLTVWMQKSSEDVGAIE